MLDLGRSLLTQAEYERLYAFTMGDLGAGFGNTGVPAAIGQEVGAQVAQAMQPMAQAVTALAKRVDNGNKSQKEIERLNRKWDSEGLPTTEAA